MIHQLTIRPRTAAAEADHREFASSDELVAEDPGDSEQRAGLGDGVDGRSSRVCETPS
jgi:hypothetical protein